MTEVAVGDRVATPWLAYACGVCDHCVSGRETLCHEQKNMVRGVFEPHAAGKMRVIREVRPLNSVNESMADVEAGRVAARVVFEP